ncbi:uncharacterized protein LOC110968810 isoform X1 [Acanthochromis polyacanthus]|uniref:uncharacterized protein LOC110968810 isoform X1 n=1 Tax=Acanthochromis polyacanthus TaxID=80966 RepID=UPI0022347226|nr:uncharacterized protein LOC110968810 isoform X1 [Acanthochromis polyacanthus]
MACTSQSALNYVESARNHLVGELQNLSVILENLYQKGVLSDEEVRNIQAERDGYDKTRKILDSVMKKGEAACYEFLRIIHVTRKRTLGRPTPLSEKNTGASTGSQKFDLHHWISCFSFKEETQMDVDYLQGPKPCHRYQTKLKEKAQKSSNEFWNASKKLFEENRRPDLSYTSLVLDTQKSPSPSKIKKWKRKKSKMSQTEKLRTYIPEDKPEISPTDLLNRQENILLVGKPGIGKTAVVREMLRLWAEKDNKELDYMFYFDMRETSQITPTMSLEDLLFNAFSEPDVGVDEVLQDIKSNSDNVTIIFDGITDLSLSVVQRLVDKELLPDAKIIITCRPDDEEDFFSGDCLRVEVKGFSEQNIKSYLSATLCDAQKVLSSLGLLTLCHVPMYALMVAACSSSEDSPQPCTITEIYIDIVRYCLQIKGNKTKNKDLNTFINTKREEILSLAEIAFHATQGKGKSVNLTEVPCEDSCVLSFLKPLFIKETETRHTFLHYTLQEFFAAVWLLKNPDEIRNVFQQCLTEEMKHMKHLIPFMCRLLNEKSPSWMKCLIPAEELSSTSDWFFKELITTLVPDVVGTEDSGLDVNTLFLCQCLYESQCPEACVYLLDKLDYRLDLCGESLDPYLCCAVAYVVNQSQEQKIRLNLDDVTISEQGMRQLFGCLQNVQWCDPLQQQLWKIFLLGEGEMDLATLLVLDDNQLHLPVEGKEQLFERAVEVMKRMTRKVNVCLYWDRETPVCQSLCESLIEALPSISSLSFKMTNRSPGLWNEEQFRGALERQQRRLLLDLCLKAALHIEQSFPNVVNVLLSLFPNQTDLSNLCLDLYQHVRSEGFLSVIPKLRLLFQSAPAVWSINLSERKTSILLEVLKLQSTKKPVELTGWSDEKSEVRSFLQCLPYISQLSFMPQLSEPLEETRFLGNLVCAAVQREQQTGKKIVELLSVCRYKTFPLKEKWCDFLLDLYCYETKTGLSVLPSSQSAFQSGPAIWSINLSERKTSILLEVLKLQSKKKKVELTGWSHEENEVRSFLQCLPYISQLSVQWELRLDEPTSFFGNLLCAAAEREQQTGEKILEQLSSVCRYKTFPFNDRDDFDIECREVRSDFLLDLFSKVKECETKTGLSFFPSLQSVFQSAPAVWPLNLSKGKTSILLEVLKLQSEKKRVELRDWSDEESEVRSFLQCLPYISQLCIEILDIRLDETTRLFADLFCAAAEREQQTGEKILEQLSSMCSYETFPEIPEDGMDLGDDEECQTDFLLDLFSYVKDYETETGLSVLPSLQSVFQSAPARWFISLSQRKTSILLEVLKLQSEKKPVYLTDQSDEESEVRSLLQCLPYISQLCTERLRLNETTKFFGNVFCAAAEREQQTGEKILEQLSSVCRYETFPFEDTDFDSYLKYQSDFLLDLFSHLKDCETKTGLTVLPSLQSVFQSAPAGWSIKLLERKTSILLEVLKLQSEKKPVYLTGWSDEESEVRNFLQCLPYVSQLRVQKTLPLDGTTRLFVNLFCAAAEREQQTGEKILELLSSVCRYEDFPLKYRDDDDKEFQYQSDFLLDLFSHVKDYETKTGLSVLPSLQSVFQSAPAGWSIKLSERKTSILLEVLKLQSEKKPVYLPDPSHEESEMRSFLQCLPYISQLSVQWELRLNETTRFFGNLLCAAAEREQQTGEKILELLSSVCRYKTFPFNDRDRDDFDFEYRELRSDFLLDLFSHLKEYETKTGLSVLSSLQSVFQSAPAVWPVDLSKGKTSVLLEVLKLQSEKKQVALTDWSHEESEVRSFLQCLPYISQLCIEILDIRLDETTRLFADLFCAAAEREQQTGEKILEQLSSMCSYETFPEIAEDGMDLGDDEECQTDFLLDLFSYVKDYETETGLSVLPSLQSVLQSAPAGWYLNLSQRKTSILLEVLKLQSEKKPVYLTGWSDEESEVRSLLQCLPYISQLSTERLRLNETTKFFRNVFCAAAEREQQTGEKILELLSSVCRYETFPLKDIVLRYEMKYQSDFLLDLFSHLKDCETKTGLSVLPSLQSVFQSAPAGWSIKLLERKTSILLEVLKLQSEKKPVYLTDWSDEESEVRNFLQCLPYISQLRVNLDLPLDETARLFESLFCAAAEREQQTGEKILELLSSVCSDETFPVNDMDNHYQSAFLLDLFSHLKDCETKTGLSVLPSLKSVFQAGPAVWFIDLSERKTSILLEVLKLQSEKKQVRLTGWSHEESEMRGFLQCLPYISELSCGPDFFQSVCSSISVRSRQEVQQLVSLLQLLDFKLLLTGKLSRRTCCSVGRVLQLCGSRVDLSLTAKKMSVRRTSLLFRKPTQLHSLRLSNAEVLLLFQWVRRSRLMCPLTVEELCLVTEENQASERALLKVVSSLCSLLRSCSVRQLVLTESCIPAQCLIPLLLLHGPPPIKLSEDHVEQLLVLVHEVQDQDLTLSLLSAVDGDLTSCSLNWELLHYLLQQSPAQTITVDLRMNLFLQESAARLLPFLGRIVIKRPSPSLVMTSIRELYRAHTSHMVPSLLRSLDHVINLSSRELDSVDSAALLFTLRHSDRVKLNLRWTSIPEEGTRSILSMLDRVSELSVDRNQLLRFIHCCAASDAQQEAASGLLRTLQHRLDLSCQSCVDLQEEDETEPLSLTVDDCRAASMVLKHCNPDTQLHLQDCEVEDGGLDLLFSVLDRVRLRVSKSVLLQLLSLLPVHSERDTVRRAESLCGALGGQLDLSNSTLNQRVCGGLIQMLDSCEGLTELNLSDCQLSDQLLLPLITHLHKVQVLDLRYNQITDASTDVLLQLISIHSSIHTVRLFSNDIVDSRPFKKHKQFEMW